ncbi:MAG TPA: alpha/beta fold hydrolase [Nocardioides sp.]|uniref:alpha/beta fold hydrolase n=1 Tax=Nocardioides sp. TaxID=35761 RepID=UPI002E31C57F|nr:alpha/beta fold hydrolase [Nocardioides sp.]HEX5087878.1 alpha/beta fold hydrolase [Nocardioides sp.]
MPSTEPEVLEVGLPAVRLSCLAWGPADGPLVVALHGFPDTARTWRHLGPHLAERGHRVVAPYLRGYAPSGLARDGYHVGALMADAVGLHSELGGDARTVLVGHDWGAITANALGAHPDSPYRRVVALAVPPLGAVRGASLRLAPRQLRMSWYTVFNQLPLLPERTVDRWLPRLWRDWSPGYDAAEDVAMVRAAWPTRDHVAAAVGYYRAIRAPWRVPPSYRAWARTLGAVPTVPLLVLHGADDGAMQPGYAEHAARNLPGTARLEMVAGAGHFLHLERPDVVNRLVAEFVTESATESAPEA